MSILFRHAALPVLLLTCACVTPGPGPQAVNPNTPSLVASTPPGGGVLYGRDGQPVVVGPAPAVRVEGEPKRDIGEGEGGRASLLELYTNAVRDKAALMDELAAVKMTLEKERTAVAEGTQERSVLRGELTKLIRERDALQAENMDLAARLTTAQIARLEVQKELLQIQIDARMREQTAETIQGASKGDGQHVGGGHK